MKPGWDKRIYDRREGRKSARFIDRTGMVAHRLVFMEWLGKWRGKHYWRAQCECGRQIDTQWKPAATKSCGCLQAESRKAHGWETQRTDGRWGLKDELRLRLADGSETTLRKMAEQVGLSRGKMLWRVRKWPEHRWLEPKHYTGAAAKQRGELIAEKAREKTWHRRPQPWASATMKKINEEGLAYRKTRPASPSEAPAGPSDTAAVRPAGPGSED